MRHTPGPWVACFSIEHGDIGSGWWAILKGAWDIGGNQAEKPGVVADSKYSAMTAEENKANACRIVACVNGCEGINPEAVPDLLKACKEVATMAVSWEPLTPGDIASVRAAIAKAEEGTDG